MYYETLLTMDETDGGAPMWLVTVPAFPEITTFGDTEADASVNGLKAIEEAVGARMSDGEDVPAPLATCQGSRCVEISALTYLKIALYTICRAKAVTRAELARRLGWHREQVDRLFRLDHKSQLDQLEMAFKAVGETIRFSMPHPAQAA
ncbi:MAG: type II toxin-antitoxin system HicB family antitoxin [Pseudomonadota bacterium]